MKPNSRLLCSLEYKSAMKDQNTETVNTENTVVQMKNARAMAEEKRRSGREAPFLNWRYILFIWNDSDEEMDIARRLAADIGVDRLCWEITDHPEDGYSRRFVPGSARARTNPCTPAFARSTPSPPSGFICRTPSG